MRCLNVWYDLVRMMQFSETMVIGLLLIRSSFFAMKEAVGHGVKKEMVELPAAGVAQNG